MTSGPFSVQNASLPRPHVGRIPPAYVCLRADGHVVALGDIPVHGSAARRLDCSASAMTFDPDAGGYWVASRGGQVVPLGVPDLVGTEGVPSGEEIVDVVATVGGRGLWALDTAGGVFCFGDARYHGSVPGLGLDTPVHAVALAPTSGGGGYWVLDRTGGVFCFGDARYHGSVPELGGAAAPTVALLAETAGDGYAVVTEDGSCIAFGRAADLGSVTAHHPIVAATRAPDGALLVDVEGIVYPLGMAPFLGSAVGSAAAVPIVDIAWYAPSLSG